MRYNAIIQFLKEIEKFKTCERTCHTSSFGRAESDAEHSWHLALFLMLLENEFQGADFTKLIKIALIHDLPEIYAGDTNPYRGDTENKEEKERKAAKSLFAGLPDDLKTVFMELFEEYLNQQSLEARIVKSADKLMPLIQNICTNDNHSSYRKLKVKYEEVEAYMDQFFPEDDALKQFYVRLLEESNSKGVFSKAGATKP
jgi:5'-deoxynucleotidase YfbR-like HD superfamily hydrolase